MGGELPDEPATVAGAAQDVGLDAEQVRAWTESGDAVAALAADRTAARDPLPAARLLDHKLGGPAEERRYTCPSYIAITEATGATTAPGYQPIESYEVMLANVAPGLHRRDEPSGVAEVLAWAGTPLATAEVALAVRHGSRRDARGARRGRCRRAPRRRRRLLVALTDGPAAGPGQDAGRRRDRGVPR